MASRVLRNSLVLLCWALSVQPSHNSYAVEMPYTLNEEIEEDLEEDDNPQAVKRMREGIVERGFNHSYGVVMFAGLDKTVYSRYTIPIWRKYCKKHGMDFILQEERLVDNPVPDWSIVRLMIEVTAKAKKWKYMMYINPDTLPVNFNKPWTYAIKSHLRKKAYNNDNALERVGFAPQDCMEDAGDGLNMQLGGCYGPLVSTSMWWVKPKKLMPFLLKWYSFRESDSLPKDSRAVREGMRKTKEGRGRAEDVNFMDAIHWENIVKDIGKDFSKNIAIFEGNREAETRDLIIQQLVKHRILGEIVNKEGEHKPEL